MTIRFLNAWNGYDDQDIATLSSAEESRLVGLGLATYTIRVERSAPATDSMVFKSVADIPTGMVGPVYEQNGIEHFAVNGDLIKSNPDIRLSQLVNNRINDPLSKPMNAAVTVTSGLWTANLATTHELKDLFVNGQAHIEGGAYVVDGTNIALKSATVAVGNLGGGVTGGYGTVNSAEFYTDASELMFRLFSPQNSGFKLFVDGNIVSNKAARRIIDLSGQATGATSFIKLDFTSNGGAMPRLIRWEWDTISTIRISTNSGAKIWKPYINKPKVCFFGDSFCAFGAGQTYATPTFGVDNIPSRIGKLLNLAVTASGVGGTGYGNNGGSNYNFVNPLRLADLQLHAFDSFVLVGGTNDGSPDSFSVVRQNCLAVINHIRSFNQNAEIIVLGCLNSQVSSTNSQAVIEEQIALAVGDSNGAARFVPITTDQSGSWITAGNLSTYIAADGVHALPGIGEAYFSERVAEKIYKYF